MNRVKLASGVAAGIGVFFMAATCRASTTLMNDQGASAPCIGIGPIAAPIAETCAEKFEQAGFIRMEQLGVSGLTLGASATDDGAIAAVEPGSPAAQAGLAVGDVIESVNGHAVHPLPGAAAAQATFGPSGQPLHMKVRRDGADLDLTVMRAPLTVSGAPTSDQPFVGVHPLINWQGRFIPCMGAGPVGFAAIAWCVDHFKAYGFIKTADAGTTGFGIDLSRTDAAIITTAAADSPAARAGVHPGDQIETVEGKPLSPNLSAMANALLFGKIGDKVRVTVRRNGNTQSVNLILAAKNKS